MIKKYTVVRGGDEWPRMNCTECGGKIDWESDRFTHEGEQYGTCLNDCEAEFKIDVAAVYVRVEAIERKGDAQ